MSVLTYNGITFHFAKTAALEFDTARDKSGTDVIANTTTIRARGVASLTTQVPTDSASLLPTIRHMLNMPRRRILYQVGGYTIVSWQPFSGAPDALLGPMPMKPASVEPHGNGSFFVDVSYRVSTYDCGEASLTDPVTSLRWTQSESFDEKWVSTIETSGTLHVRADLMQNADNFRALCVPPLLPDYRRTGYRITLAPDGLSLDFSFTDVEQSLLPPYPAIKASGRFTVQCERPGVKRAGQVDITLEGAKGCSRRDLMNVALRMAYSKLQAEGFASGTPIVWGSFSEDLFDPQVTVSMHANLPPLGGGGFSAPPSPGLASLGGGGRLESSQSDSGAPAVMKSVGQTPGVTEYRPGIAPPVRKRLLGLVAAGFRDPCIAAEGIVTELRNSPGNSSANGGMLGSGNAPVPPTVSVGVGPTGTAGTAVKDFAPYDAYIVEAKWELHSGKVVMPGTGVGPTPNRGEVVTVSGQSMTLEVSWFAQRTGMPPVLPSFNAPDPNLVALSGTVIPSELSLAASGSSIVYKVAGHYSYGVIDPDKAMVTAPIPPFLSLTTVQPAAKDAAAHYSHDILWSFVGATSASQTELVSAGRGNFAQPVIDTVGQVIGEIITGPVTGTGLPPGALGAAAAGAAVGGLLPWVVPNP